MTTSNEPAAHGFHHAPVPPDARRYQGMRAGVVTRTAAGAVDYAITLAAVVATYAGWGILLFLLNPRGFTWPTWPFVAFLLLGWCYLFCYLTVAWATTGRTVGARLMGVRVVSFRGRRMHVVAAIVRSAFCAAFPVGLFWCVVSPQNRSLQDAVLRTSVIHDWTTRGGPSLAPRDPAA